MLFYVHLHQEYRLMMYLFLTCKVKYILKLHQYFFDFDGILLSNSLINIIVYYGILQFSLWYKKYADVYLT